MTSVTKTKILVIMQSLGDPTSKVARDKGIVLHHVNRGYLLACLEGSPFM